VIDFIEGHKDEAIARLEQLAKTAIAEPSMPLCAPFFAP